MRKEHEMERAVPAPRLAHRPARTGRAGLARVGRPSRARGAAGDGAGGDRARLLGRTLAERDRGRAADSTRDGEDEDAERAHAACRAARGRGASVSGPDFDELVGDELAPGEREWLRRAHDALLAAGPPPELPASLARPRGARRSPRAIVLPLAAALAIGAGFAGGW